MNEVAAQEPPSLPPEGFVEADDGGDGGGGGSSGGGSGGGGGGGGNRKPPPPPRRTEDGGERERSNIFKAIKAGQDKSLRELIESFGAGASFQVKLERTEPDQFFDPHSGRTFNTGGFVGKFENKVIDEEFVAQRFGGGTYAVKFMDKRPGSGSWHYAGQITIKVAGDPDLTEHRVKAGIAPNGGAPNAGAAANTENPSLAKEAMSMMRDQLNKAEERASRGNGDGNDAMLAIVREQLAAAREEAARLHTQIRELANKPAAPAAPARSVFEEKMFGALLEGDSARNTNLREMHAAEIGALKTSHATDLKLVGDRYERMMEDLKRSHQATLDGIRASNELALASSKASFETQLAAAKGSFELQIKLLESENRKLDGDNKELRVEVKELRAKKDIDLVEMVKKIETVKDALGAGDDDDTSTVGKIVEAVSSPAMWEGVGAMVNQLRPPQPAAAPQQQLPAAGQTKRQIVRNKDTGQRFWLMPDGNLQPLPDKKPKKAVEEGATAEGPAEPQLPQIDPAAIATTVALLESAFSGGQEPEIVAQSNRSRVPEDLLAAIRDHGIDVVLTKMAKLSSSSPLSSQAGRNWLRKLGKELVGE